MTVLVLWQKKNHFFPGIWHKLFLRYMCKDENFCICVEPVSSSFIPCGVFQSETRSVPIITLPSTQNMSWKTPSRTLKKNWGMFKQCQKPTCVLGDYDEVSFSIENIEISENSSAKAQLVPGQPTQLAIRSEASQFSTSLPSVSQMTVMLFKPCAIM